MDPFERAALVVAEMTLAECIQQLRQTPLNQITEDDLRAGLGSVILAGSATAGNDDVNSFNAAEMSRLQRIAVEKVAWAFRSLRGGILFTATTPSFQFHWDRPRRGTRIGAGWQSRRCRRVLGRWGALDVLAHAGCFA